MGRRLPTDLGLFLGLHVVLVAVFLLGAHGPLPDDAYLAGSILTGLFATAWALAPRRRGAVPLMLAAALVLESAGDALTLVLSDADGDLPVPSWADVPYLASAVLAVSSMLLLVWWDRRHARSAGPDSVIATGGLLVLAVQVGLWPAMTDSTSGLVAKLVSGFYAVEDLVLLGVAGWLLLARRRVPLGWLLIAGSSLVWFGVDLWWAIVELTDGSWHNGTWRDLLWYLPDACFAVAIRQGVDVGPGSAEPGLTSRRLLIVGGAGLAGPLGLVALSAAGADVPVPVIALSSLVPLCAALARMYLILRRLEQEALHDPLTGLLNRRALTAHARHLLAQGDLEGIVLVDLDGFKAVNDRHGHAAGDTVLVTVARRLLDAVPHGARVARLGGDEFAVLVPRGVRVDALVLDERLRGPVVHDGAEVNVGASVGWGPAPSRASAAGLESALAAADADMYRAKRAGRAATALPAPRPPTVPGAAVSGAAVSGAAVPDADPAPRAP